MVFKVEVAKVLVFKVRVAKVHLDVFLMSRGPTSISVRYLSISCSETITFGGSHADFQ